MKLAFDRIDWAQGLKLFDLMFQVSTLPENNKAASKQMDTEQSGTRDNNGTPCTSLVLMSLL